MSSLKEVLKISFLASLPKEIISQNGNSEVLVSFEVFIVV